MSSDLLESSEAARCFSTRRPLTHSSDSSREGLAVKATQPCSAPQCERPLIARGLCIMHYRRWQKRGTVDAPPSRIKYCSTTGCEDRCKGNGLCANHYRRQVKRSAPECSIIGCVRRCKTSQGEYCEPHYRRVHRGQPLDIPSPLGGRPCVVEDCSRLATMRDAGGLCAKHYLRKRIRGAADFEFAGLNHPNWTGDSPSYEAAHKRVRRTKGPARSFDCVDCNGRARHWSYRHDDPAELWSDEVRAWYSTSLDSYEPRCVRCHHLFDRTWIARRAEAAL